ncbi:MAG: rhomboid family intramembrane serine protease [Nitriliruptoraceae bacterium]
MTDVQGPPPAPDCYRHPGRPALLRCSRCERPVCGADAIEAPVGYQCPECASGAIPARRLRDVVVDARVTKILLGLIGVAFVVTQVAEPRILQQFGLVPVAVGDGAFWLVITSGFLHSGLMHVAFNGILLWRLGEMLEPALGHARFAALYLFGLLGGSLGVVLLAWATVATPLASIPVLSTALGTHPLSVTVGASGAVFGLMGAAISGMRVRGVNPWRTDIGSLVLLNLVLTFVIPGISVGGHVGGLLAGMAAGKLLLVASRRAITVFVLAGVLFVATITLANAMNAAILSLLR